MSDLIEKKKLQPKNSSDFTANSSVNQAKHLDFFINKIFVTNKALPRYPKYTQPLYYSVSQSLSFLPRNSLL